MNGFVELVDDLVKLLPVQFGPEAVDITLRLLMPLEPLRALGGLRGRIAALLDLRSVPLPASGELDQLWMIADLSPLRIVQVTWRPAVTFESAYRSYQIIAPPRTQEDSEAVFVNEIRHVVSLIDVATIAHYLSPLLGGQCLYGSG